MGLAVARGRARSVVAVDYFSSLAVRETTGKSRRRYGRRPKTWPPRWATRRIRTTRRALGPGHPRHPVPALAPPLLRIRPGPARSSSMRCPCRASRSATSSAPKAWGRIATTTASSRSRWRTHAASSTTRATASSTPAAAASWTWLTCATTPTTRSTSREAIARLMETGGVIEVPPQGAAMRVRLRAVRPS